MRFFCVKLLIVLISSSAWSQEHSVDKIEEAQGLSDELSLPAKAWTAANEKLRLRSYLLFTATDKPPSQYNLPKAEASLTSDYKTDSGMTFFIDGIVDYYDLNHRTQTYLNQLGLRYQFHSQLAAAIGKERNRRSPGIVISPSDLLFAQAQLPGQLEDRRGIWLGRLSYQLPKSSYDLFLLPLDSMSEFGWPTSDSKYQGTLARTLQQLENLDVSFSIGEIDHIHKAGIAGQGVWSKVYKLYYEGGYSEKYTSVLGTESQGATQHLAGLSYEGDGDWSIKAEYFFNGQGLEPNEFERYRSLILLAPSNAVRAGDTAFSFLRKQYAILSVSGMDLANRYNLFLSVIKSLEDASNLELLRAEWLINDQLVTGITGIFLNGGTETQYFLKSFSQLYQIDLKYSF